MENELKDKSTAKAYSVEYRDDNGVIETTLYSYGTKINITLRGVQFEGDHLANLVPIAETDLSLLSQFPSNVLDDDNWLEHFALHITIPITVVTDEEHVEEAVVELEITPEPSIYSVFLTFRQQRHNIRSLEYGLDPKRTPIPHIKYAKICLNCVYGDYWPFGGEDNWDMICFKEGKMIYRQYLRTQASYKRFISKVMNAEEFEILQTQETYCCEEFDPKTGDQIWH